jgi:hypothetical protein
MPLIQTIIFEDIDIDRQTNKLLCVQPIHKCSVQDTFPIAFSFGVISSIFDLAPGNYTATHTIYRVNPRKEIFKLNHKPLNISQKTSLSLRTNFENIPIDQAGDYVLVTEVGKFKGEEIPLKFELVSHKRPTKTTIGKA